MSKREQKLQIKIDVSRKETYDAMAYTWVHICS